MKEEQGPESMEQIHRTVQTIETRSWNFWLCQHEQVGLFDLTHHETIYLLCLKKMIREYLLTALFKEKEY